MPIPISEVESYLRLRHPEFDVDQRMEFLEMISRLDGRWFRTTKELGGDDAGSRRGAGRDDEGEE